MSTFGHTEGGSPCTCSPLEQPVGERTALGMSYPCCVVEEENREGRIFSYLKTIEELKLKPNRLASQNSSYFKQVYGSLVMHQSKAIVLKILFFP